MSRILALIALVGSLFALWVAVPVVRNVNGYCETTGKYITRDEMFDAAINSILARQKARCYAAQGRSCVERIPYESKEQFLALNANCCTTVPDPESPAPGLFNLWFRATGKSAGHVYVSYARRERRSDGTIEARKSTEIFRVTNCGLVLPDS